MALPVLIIGKSGSGKTASLRNLPREKVALICTFTKDLPFRGSFDTLSWLQKDTWTSQTIVQTSLL